MENGDKEVDHYKETVHIKEGKDADQINMTVSRSKEVSAEADMTLQHVGGAEKRDTF